MSYISDKMALAQAMAELMKIHQTFIAKHEELVRMVNAPLKQGPPGPQGAKPTADEVRQHVKSLLSGITEPYLRSLIMPLIPQIKEASPGTAGKDAVITQKHIEMAATLASKKIKMPKLNPEIDPLKIIDIILNLPEGKRLTTKHIDGLEQTIEAIKNQTKHGYLHGGGDTVKAGTNITITTNADGTKTITSTGASGTWYEETLARTDGTNYTLAHTPTSIAFIFLNGQKIIGGGVDYTRTGASVVMTSQTLSTDIITAAYS